MKKFQIMNRKELNSDSNEKYKKTKEFINKMCSHNKFHKKIRVKQYL